MEGLVLRLRWWQTPWERLYAAERLLCLLAFPSARRILDRPKIAGALVVASLQVDEEASSKWCAPEFAALALANLVGADASRAVMLRFEPRLLDRLVTYLELVLHGWNADKQRELGGSIQPLQMIFAANREYYASHGLARVLLRAVVLGLEQDDYDLYRWTGRSLESLAL